MKKICIVVLFSFLTVISSLAQGLAKSCSSIQGITAITLSKSMLSIAGDVLSSGAVDYDEIIDNLDQIEIVSASDKSQVSKAKGIVDTYLGERKDFDSLVDIVDDDSRIGLYMRQISGKSGQQPVYEYLITIARDDDEYTAVLLIGSITPSDLSSSLDLNI